MLMKWKRFLCMGIAAALLCQALPMELAQAKEAQAENSAPQAQDAGLRFGMISGAAEYALGETQKGTLTENGEEGQYYKFTLPSSGKIQITGMAYMEYIGMALYDADAQELWSGTLGWNSTSEVIPIDQTFFLASGTYYVSVYKRYGCFGDYNFMIETTSSDETFPESGGGSNNSMDAANEVEMDGQEYHAQLALNDEKDFWKLTLDTSGEIDFNATFYHMEYVQWKLYDENGEELLRDNPGWNSTTENITVAGSWNLTKGTYYISASLYGSYGKYCFSLLFSPSNESYSEPNGGSNNTVGTASDMELGKAYTGQLAINDEKDFYRFDLEANKMLEISISSPMERLWVKLFDERGEEVWTDYLSWNQVLGRIAYTRSTSLEKGTYYLALQRYDNYNEYEGNYSVKARDLTKENCPHKSNSALWRTEKVTKASVSQNGSIERVCSACGAKSKTVIYAAKYIKLTKATFTYNGKTQKPGVTLTDSQGKILRNGTDYTLSYSGNCKDVGKYKITAVLKGNYAGTRSSSITIRPKGLGISKIEPNSRDFRVRWKKQTVQTKGYELQYSTTSKFSKKDTKKVMLKNTTTSKKVTGVKPNKNYYVRIRSYKEVSVDGKKEKIYSAWSKTKQTKTKR